MAFWASSRAGFPGFEMRIAFASDIHTEIVALDYYRQTVFTKILQTADVVILAGDIATTPDGLRAVAMWLRAKTRAPILFVLGNHEYYQQVFPSALRDYHAALSDVPAAYLLEKSKIRIGGVRFLGCTLWTDFAGGRHLATCEAGMNDFALIVDVETNKPIRAARIAMEHAASVDWLDTQFPDPMPTVVVTHHAPSFLSNHPRFAGSSITGGFCANLDERILSWRPKLWIHGHLHDPVEYTIGKTMIVSHPWGYPDERGRIPWFRILDLEI
ncbi:metallophosphoesterase [Acidithiobacillus caldus]|uniref:metallophosphoesterase n=1 Tax=Acidithiobacillus caldus TaxID=33059 RepID=UPI001F3F6106|nr:metallophosphoesterase [Acidithiobacillus caldus]